MIEVTIDNEMRGKYGKHQKTRLLIDPKGRSAVVFNTKVAYSPSWNAANGVVIERILPIVTDKLATIKTFLDSDEGQDLLGDVVSHHVVYGDMWDDNERGQLSNTGERALKQILKRIAQLLPQEDTPYPCRTVVLRGDTLS